MKENEPNENEMKDEPYDRDGKTYKGMEVVNTKELGPVPVEFVRWWNQ